MQDKEVSIRSVIAVMLWVGGTVLVALDLLLTRYRIGHFGLVCVGGAMTLQVRGYFCRLHRRMSEVFTMGRDYERGEGRVRSLRR